jgi:hypothetical protein
LESIDLSARLDEMREICSTQKKRVYENIQTMLRELAELGHYPIPEKVFKRLTNNSTKTKI